jgi:hypothetical protein
MLNHVKWQRMRGVCIRLEHAAPALAVVLGTCVFLCCLLLASSVA